MIRTEESGRLRVVRLDRPDRRNALDREGLGALEATISTATEPVIYLTGTGPAFCAGADLDVVESLDGDPEAAEEFARAGQSALNAIETAESVVVAGVDGPARGGGVELTLAADIRIGTPDASFAEPGVSMGIFGAWGGTRRLPRAVGETNALDLSLSGRTVDGREARSMGLVSRITDDPRSVAEEVAAHDPAALRTVKHLVRSQRGQDEQEDREATAFAALLEDGLE